MKLSSLLLLITALQSFALSYSQETRFSFKAQNKTMLEVLRMIENQSAYRFFFSDNYQELSSLVNLEAKNEDLSKVLKNLLNDKNISYKLLDNDIVVIAPIKVLQQKKISGTLTDATTGEPIIGANVIVEGTTIGTVSDITGKFTIDVPSENSVLTISFVGYNSERIELQGKTSLDIKLIPDIKSLEEVVVVGFGTQKKVNLTGSVGIATAKELESRPVASATQALQGIVPGLIISTNTGELDKAMNISIRGTGTIGKNSSGAPLILIDGMEADLNTVNYQDIENISVLKDAASSSVYGSRAPFGVILITTKSGKKGKVSINYNNSFRMASPIGLPESMDSYTFANMMNSAIMNNGGGVRFNDTQLQKMLDFQAGILTGGLDPSPTNPKVWEDPWTGGYANTDLYAETFKTNVASQEHNLSAMGGTDKMTYYASFQYLDQGGLLKIGDDGLKRYNLTGKFNATLTKWLKFNYSSRFTRNDVWRPTAFSGYFYNLYGRQNWPFIPMYDPNGYIYGANATALELGGKYNLQSDRQYHQGAFIFEPVKNWITNVELNYSMLNEGKKEITLPAYTHDPQGNIIDTQSTSSLLQEQKKEDYMNLNIFSEYSRSFNDAHNFKIMGGFQAEEMKQNDFSVNKAGLLFYDLPVFNLTSGAQGNGAALTPTVNGYANEWAVAGFFGRLNYDFKGRYLFEGALRYDGTSRFRTGKQWQWSPSFSAGWNLAQENFWEPFSNVVNVLKPRISYGVLSNQNTKGWYPTYRGIEIKPLDGLWMQNGVKPNRAYVGDLISTSLTWETVRSWNTGIDFGLLNNRLSGTFEYFIRYTEDMVDNANELPATLGLTAPPMNSVDLHTKGWELQLSWRDRLKNGFSYGVSMNLSDQITIVDKYPNNLTGSIYGKDMVSSSSNNDINYRYMEGKQIGMIWGFETVGIAKTQEEMDAHLASLPNGGQSALGSQWAAGDIMYKDLNGDGKISTGAGTWDDHGDLKILGDSESHYYAGLDLTAEWKGFDFRCFFQGVLKRDFWPGGYSGDGNDGAGGYFWGVRGNKSEWHMRGFKQHEDYFRAEPIGLEGHEIPANVDSYFPRVIVNNGGKNQRVQTRYMQHANYIRLKNLQLGYSLPSAWMKKVGISKCRVFVSGENLLTLTPLFDVFDPETLTGGVGGNAYPLSRVWSYGISLTF
jgi:TonB-linked SusC/RagA family outer membrane protein